MRQLYPYQKRGLKKLIRDPRGGALLYEPGLGKTLTTIRASQEVKPVPSKIVVVCPVSAIGVWRDELEAEHEVVIVPTGTRKQKAETIRKAWDGNWIILNYEALLDKAVVDAILAQDPDLVILDEAHKIKNPTAKRSKAAHKISEGRRTWVLTGTPVTQNLLDLYSIYKAIDPGIWNNESWTRFKQRYAIFGGFEGREVVGIRNPEQLLNRVRPLSVAARKEDVLDLPPRRDQLVPVYLEGKEWKQYRELAQTGVLSERDWITDNPLTLALRLQQLVGEFKLPYTVGRIEELLEAGEKVVVFYRFNTEGIQIAAKLQRLGVSMSWVHGAVKSDQRDEEIERFQNHDGPAVFLGQIQATSTAITLTAAHEVIYHSMTWSYEDAVQSRDRVYRIGQDHPVRYQHIVAVGPHGGKLIDGLVLDALARKEDFASAVLADPGILEVTDEHFHESKPA